jgi:long-chain acyl-CoA synthetase
LKSALVGVVVPDEMALGVWCQKNNVPFEMQKLVKSPQLKQMVLGSFAQLAKENGLNPLEQVKDIYLHPEPFTPQNGLLTASMKSKRHDLQKRFQAEIDAMYKNID